MKERWEVPGFLAAPPVAGCSEPGLRAVENPTMNSGVRQMRIPIQADLRSTDTCVTGRYNVDCSVLINNQEDIVRRLAIVLFVFLVVMVSSVSAFNGQRKGFVLGGGIGFAPLVKWSTEVGPFDYSESKAGVAVHLLIGYAWDEQNMIVYEGNATGYSDDEVFDEPVTQGFDGAAWYHYYGVAGKSSFTVVGLGLYAFDAGDYKANDPGLGIMLGAGYEFARHWQVGGYISVGRTTDSPLDFDHANMSVVISTVAF